MNQPTSPSVTVLELSSAGLVVLDDQVSANSATLTVRDLTVDFRVRGGDVRAVRSVSFEVRPGQTVVLLGESGSGKSVTARAILRLHGSRAVVGGGPKAPHLAAHLAALGVPAGQAVLVGDTVDDAEAARSVGAAIVLYDGGITDAARLRATGAPVVSSLLDAVELASRLPSAPSVAPTPARP